MKVKYLEKIPKDKAVLFLSNHQNALLDPLLITVNSTRKNYFLTRAQVFSKPFVARLLKSIQMIPVYRMRDGIQNIQKNIDIFSYCTELLHNKQSIILFPEGGHSLRRTIRTLSKGFTRIIEETYQKHPEIELIIIPVGVNYQYPKEYGDVASVYFGEHIDASIYFNENKIDVQGLKNVVSTGLKQLTVFIKPDDTYETSLAKLIELKVDFTDPVAVNMCIENGYNYTGKQLRPNSFIYKFLRILLITMYSIPYLIWKKTILPKIDEIEFTGTFLFAIIITLTPLFLFFEVFIITLLFGKSVGLLFLGIGIILPLITVRVK